MAATADLADEDPRVRADEDPRSAVEEAVQQRIAAARARVARRRADRATRARRRAYGVAQRHAAKLTHLDSLRTADGTPDPQETDPC
jgi:hypothetical protein